MNVGAWEVKRNAPMLILSAASAGAAKVAIAVAITAGRKKLIVIPLSKLHVNRFPAPIGLSRPH
jgi:hypothetical protein